jgi:hypothetical protein
MWSEDPNCQSLESYVGFGKTRLSFSLLEILGFATIVLQLKFSCMRQMQLQICVIA